MTGSPSPQTIVDDACILAASNVIDFAVLVHPLPWSDDLEDEIQGMLLDVMETIVLRNEMVAAVADPEKVRIATVAAFHDRLARLSLGAEAAGNA